MQTKRILALVIAVMMLAAVMLPGCGQPAAEPSVPAPAPAEPAPAPAPDDSDDAPALGRTPYEPPSSIITELPRNETLYFNGMNWGAPNGWNAFSGDMNNALMYEQVSGGARVPMFETPYMFNPLDGTLIPLLADGDHSWNGDKTELTYKIKPAAYWSDGTKVTAHDAIFTYQAGIDYGNAGGIAFSAFIDKLEAKDDDTVIIYCKLTDDGKPTNPMMVETFLVQNYILQKAWLETLIARNNGDGPAMNMDPGDDIVWSGPYTKYFFDDTKVVMIRDDGYWGQDASMWGKLPAPKYLAHVLYEDNAAGDVAFAAGEVDVSQQFIANVQEMWLTQGLPISTYFENEPYMLSLNMPTAYFNMNSPKPGIDNPAIRKAIALAVDYDLILANAMTNQSPSFSAVPRSLMNPTPGEQAMYNRDAVAHLQWAGNDIDAANAMLDEAGITRGADGYRQIDGVRLSYTASCPFGWSDWEAAMEIVAAAGEKIGIEITTNFPDWGVYQTVVTANTHSEYDIFMMWTDSAGPSQPWSRARQLMSSEFIGIDSNWTGNWGHYRNDRADELIALIPLESDEAKVKEYYTELVEIYLTEVPSFSLMYRPDKFHIVNESVWTGFTESTDGRNVPPINCISGYAIADLYNIRLV